MKVLLSIFKQLYLFCKSIYVITKLFLNQYSVSLALITGATLTLVFAKLLYFDCTTWAGFIIEILNQVIHHFDKLVGYEPKSVLVDQPTVPQPTTNFAKVLAFGQKALVWATVGGVIVYGGLFTAGLSFGLAKLLVVSILPFMPLTKVESFVLISENGIWYDWW